MSKISFISQKLFSSASVSPVSQCQPHQSKGYFASRFRFCRCCFIFSFISASYSAQYSSQYSFQYSSQYASSHVFASHAFALHVSQHSNRFEKILHSSSKSTSISHASFNSMKDHDLKIYIN